MINIPQRINFYGLDISILTLGSLNSTIIEILNSKTSRVVYGYSLGIIPEMIKAPEIYYYGQKSDILLTDGRLLYLLAKLYGYPLKFDISIPNFVYLVLKLANESGKSVFLYGASNEINKTAISNIRQKYKGIKKVDGFDGFSPCIHLKQILTDFKPDILLIGLPSPEKERLGIQYKELGLAKIIIPCGGMIDVLGGKTTSTPMVLKKMGLASFYRVLQEPKRLARRYINIYFFLIFNFLPSFLFLSQIKRQKFSIPKYYKFDNFYK